MARGRIAFTLSVLVAGGVFSFAPLSAARLPLDEPQGRPTHGWNAPVLVHDVQAHRETSLVLSPKDPDLLFLCAPSGVPNRQYNQSYFHVSRNGGAKWSPLRVETAPTDLRNYTYEGGDCDVGFDAGGTMYAADTWLGDLSVGHSTDGGKTWEGTPLAVSAPIVDRPWLVGGPKGTIHVTYQGLQCCTVSTIWYTRSTDYGESFMPVRSVATAGPEGAFTWEGNFVVSPSGEDLYLVYTRRPAPGLTDLDSDVPETVWVAASHDSGMTWRSHLVASMPHPASYLYPSIAMDAAGFLHVVFASAAEKDHPIWYASSKDKAESWSKPVPVRRGAAGYSPWITGGTKGKAAIVWLGSPDPEAGWNTDSKWYFYWGRVSAAHTGRPRFVSGTTTTAPMFEGSMPIPEFEMVRLDDEDRMHIGMSIYRSPTAGGPGRWAIYYQSQSR